MIFLRLSILWISFIYWVWSQTTSTPGPPFIVENIGGQRVSFQYAVYTTGSPLPAPTSQPVPNPPAVDQTNQIVTSGSSQPVVNNINGSPIGVNGSTGIGPTNNSSSLPGQMSSSLLPSQPCIPGSNVGQFLFAVPNITSMFVSGSEVNLTWGYSENTKTFPTTVDVKYASESNVARNQWTLLDTIPGTQTWYFWKVPQAIATDRFRIRLVPDQKETIIMGFIGSQPCFADGMVMPTTGPAFQIVTQVSLVPYRDLFGPSSGSEFLKTPFQLFFYLMSLNVIIKRLFFHF